MSLSKTAKLQAKVTVDETKSIYAVFCWPGSMTPEALAYFHIEKEAESYAAMARQGKIKGWEFLFPGPTNGDDTAFVVKIPLGGRVPQGELASVNK